MSTMIAPSQEQQIRNDIFAACVVERMRQIEKGYDRVHDDEHGDGPLSGLAAAVAAQSADVAPVLMLAEASRMTSTWQIRPLTASGRASYMGFWRAHGLEPARVRHLGVTVWLSFSASRSGPLTEPFFSVVPLYRRRAQRSLWSHDEP